MKVKNLELKRKLLQKLVKKCYGNIHDVVYRLDKIDDVSKHREAEKLINELLMQMNSFASIDKNDCKLSILSKNESIKKCIKELKYLIQISD